MADYQYDLFVIGAGSGGVRAARVAADLGARVAIAEERELGGACVNVGCVPKKLFVYAARFAEDFETARGFGWRPGRPGFVWPTLLANKNREIRRLNEVYRKLLDQAGVDILPGRAGLVDAHAVTVNAESFTAERILIATGGRPNLPDIPGRRHIISSDDAFFLDQLPEAIIIVGGGYIAVEFAGIFNGLGVDTTLIYRGPLFLRGFERALRERLATEMRQKGIRLRFDTRVTRIERAADRLTAVLADGQRQGAGRIMYATGRRPNTAGLGLRQAGVRLDAAGAVIVNDRYQTSMPSIYALGDVTNRVNLTPVALAEGMALARHLYAGAPLTLSYDNIPTCVFSQPPLATVGLTEAEARRKYTAIAVYQSAFKPMRLALSDSAEQTLLKVIVNQASDRVIGAHMLGPEAGEIMQGIAIAIKAGVTKQVFDTTIGIHPTTAEEFVTLREPSA